MHASSAVVLARAAIDEHPEAFLRTCGELFATFGPETQDSGNVSYGVRVGAERFFVKTAGDPSDAKPRLDHAERVALLRNAVTLARAVQHPAMPRLRHVIESNVGPVLVYDWADGESIGSTAARRGDPTSAYYRFRALDPADIIRALAVVFDVHEQLAELGYVAVDFYDGSLMYDFVVRSVVVVDLDHYSRGAFRNEMGRMLGSRRFMAPEELELGAVIDQRTTVFTLGRCLFEFLGDGTTGRSAFRASPAIYEIACEACRATPGDRYPTVAGFVGAFRAARAKPVGT